MMLKRLIAVLLFACSLFCMAFVYAKEETVTVNFSDEDAETAFYETRGDAVFIDRYETQLTTFEKRIYGRLVSNIENMKKNDKDYGIEIDISDQPEYHHGNSDEIAKLALSLYTAVYAFEFDHPELFWFSKLHGFSYEYKSQSKVITKLYVKGNGENGWRSDAFPTYKSVTDAEKKFDDAANTILKDASGKGVFGTLEYFNKYIVDNCTYNPKVSAGQDYTTLGEMPWSAYSAMVKQTAESKYPVCEGYSKAFKVLCDKAGIKCILVTGSYKNAGHMWNMVRMINGLWFYVDTTFNDVEKYETKYFMRGSSMEKTHVVDEQMSGSCRPLALPAISKYDYTKAVGDSLGDANQDGKVNTADATAILRHAAGIQLISDPFAKNCADFNCDSTVNTADATGVLKYSAGM